jgi:DnaJ-class molecular chaperone
VPRILSNAQRRALNQLIGLGARLDDAFTLQELRSEFRALARLYHPDRHQTRGRAAQQTTSSFVTLRHAYDVLKAAA